MNRGVIAALVVAVAQVLVNIPAYGETKKEMLNCQCECEPASTSVSASASTSARKAPTERDSKRVILNDGLEAQINSVGRSKDGILTVSLSLVNTGKNTLYLLHVGPVLVQDNAGGSYQLNYLGGVLGCEYHETTRGCPDNKLSQTPSTKYTKVDPGRTITLNFNLFSKIYGGQEKNKGPVISLSTTFATRAVSDPELDRGMIEEDKRKDIQLMTLSIPSAAVTDAK